MGQVLQEGCRKVSRKVARKVLGSKKKRHLPPCSNFRRPKEEKPGTEGWSRSRKDGQKACQKVGQKAAGTPLGTEARTTFRRMLGSPLGRMPKVLQKTVGSP